LDLDPLLLSRVQFISFHIIFPAFTIGLAAWLATIEGMLLGQDPIRAYNRGQMGYRTPNIDRIANEGAILTDYYGQQSCTAGARSWGQPAIGKIVRNASCAISRSPSGIPGACPEGLVYPPMDGRSCRGIEPEEMFMSRLMIVV
jgi:hypothetical protein